MEKKGITHVIRGQNPRHFKRAVMDFTGTISLTGALVPGVAELLTQLSQLVDITIITSDGRGKAAEAVKDLTAAGVAELIILKGDDHRSQKALWVLQHEPKTIWCLGNGENDSSMLYVVMQAGGISYGVDTGETRASSLASCTNFIAQSPLDALRNLGDPACLNTLIGL